ncbi:hypothetical protein ABZP36_004782 [Zizania latifolia]
MDTMVVAIAGNRGDASQRRPLLPSDDEIRPHPESPSPQTEDAKLGQKPQQVASLDVFRGLTVAVYAYSHHVLKQFMIGGLDCFSGSITYDSGDKLNQRKIGEIFDHPVYQVTKTSMVELANSKMRSRFEISKDENRFHTYDYARHFVSACTRILGLEGTPEGVEDKERLTRVVAVERSGELERFREVQRLRRDGG